MYTYTIMYNEQPVSQDSNNAVLQYILRLRNGLLLISVTLLFVHM